jgi:hypothetical protein
VGIEAQTLEAQAGLAGAALVVPERVDRHIRPIASPDGT